MIECTDFERVRKGQRVRKYYYQGNERVFKDGTVEKGSNGGNYLYVRWDNDDRFLDMNVNSYDVVLLKDCKKK